jgi:hypothetical protein
MKQELNNVKVLVVWNETIEDGQIFQWEEDESHSGHAETSVHSLLVKQTI